MLADQGAEVVHVDPPSGPCWNSQANFVLNRNKFMVCLDLKTEGGVAEALRYIEHADVVIHNAPPGRMEAWGLGPELCARFPQLVYLAMPGFASKDERWRGVKAYEAIIMGAAGVFINMGLSRTLQSVNPSYSPLPLASSYAGVLGAASVVAALVGRERTGRGDAIEVPIASALMDALCFNTLDVGDLPARYFGRRKHEIERRKREGEPMNLSWEQCEELLDPFFKTYYCKDERPFYLVSMGHLGHVKRTLETLGCSEEVQAVCPFGNLWHQQRTYTGDSVLGQYNLREPYASRIAEIFKRQFRTRTSAEWEEHFAAAQVPSSATRTTEEWLNGDHARVSGLVREAVTPCGPMLVPGPLAWLSGSKELAALHRSSLNAFFAPPSQPPPPPKPSEGPAEGWLEGIKILDLCNVIAGPTVGMLSARMGASVIKIDAPEPEYGPVVMVGFGLLANRGKWSMLLNLKTTAGRNAMLRLLKQVDIVTFNGTDRQVESLGVSKAELERINPGIILYHLKAFAGPLGGPRAESVGYDDLTQSATGIMSRFGGDLRHAEEHAHIGTVDVVTGFAGLFAVCLALKRQCRTGRGEVAQTSLAAVGQIVQVPYCYDGPARVPWTEPKGPCRGEHSLYRAYMCRPEPGREEEVWGFLAATNQQPTQDEVWRARANLAAVGLPQTEVELVRFFERHSFAEAEAALASGGGSVAWVRLRSFDDMRNDALQNPSPHASFRFITTKGKKNPSGKDVTYFAPCSIRSARWRVRELQEMRRYGDDTKEILLKEVGLSEEEVGDMLAQTEPKVASISLADEYFPDSSGVWRRASIVTPAQPLHAFPEFGGDDPDAKPPPFACASSISDTGTIGQLCGQLTRGLGENRSAGISLLVLHAALGSAHVLEAAAAALPLQLGSRSSSAVLHGGTSCFGVSAAVGGEARHAATGLAAFAISDPAGVYSAGSASVAEGGKRAGFDAASSALLRAHQEGWRRKLPALPAPAFALLLVAAAPGGHEEEVLDGVHQALGPDIRVFGGTCGSDADTPATLLTETWQVRDHCVQVTLAWPSVPCKVQLSTLHDEPSPDERTATKVHGRQLLEIDGKPALETYAKWSENPQVKLAAGERDWRKASSMIDCTTLFPFGVPKRDKEGTLCYRLAQPSHAIPLQGRQGHGLELFASLKEGNKLVVMKTDRKKLQTAAGTAAQLARESAEGTGVAGAMVVYSAGAAITLGSALLPGAVADIKKGLGNHTPFVVQFTLGELGPSGLVDRDGGTVRRNEQSNLMVNLLIFGAPSAS